MGWISGVLAAILATVGGQVILTALLAKEEKTPSAESDSAQTPALAESSKPTPTLTAPHPIVSATSPPADVDLCDLGYFPGKTIEDLQGRVHLDGGSLLSKEEIERAGGMFTNDNDVSVAIEGSSDRAIILTALRIHVIERRPVRHGVLLLPVCGSGLSERSMRVNLDVSRPSPIAEPGMNVDEITEKPIKFPYKVSESDPEYFLIDTDSENCDCLWTATLHWTSAGVSGTTVISNGGKPFRSIGYSKDEPHYSWNDGTSLWERSR